MEDYLDEHRTRETSSGAQCATILPTLCADLLFAVQTYYSVCTDLLFVQTYYLYRLCLSVQTYYLRTNDNYSPAQSHVTISSDLIG